MAVLAVLRSAVLLAGLLLPALAAADEQAFFLGLGADARIVTALRADGLEVVGIQASDQGYRWTFDGGLQTVPCLIPVEPLDYCREAIPNGVSADGSVVVGTAEIDVYMYPPDPSRAVAFREVESNQSGLGFLEGHDDSGGFAVSDDGSVVVGISSSGSDYWSWFRWTEVDGMTEIPKLGFVGSFYPGSIDVSADGSVIVGTDESVTADAFRWTAAGGTVSLIARRGSVANGVSADGNVIVGAAALDGPPYSRGMRWTEATGARFLGPGGFLRTEALAVSADGSVTVGYGSTASVYEPEALVWTKQRGVRRLRSLLDNVPGLDLSGWTLLKAVDVSDDGRTIAGDGTNPQGEPEAWLVFLPAPEPGGVAMGVAALLGLAVLLRRASR